MALLYSHINRHPKGEKLRFIVKQTENKENPLDEASRQAEMKWKQLVIQGLRENNETEEKNFGREYIVANVCLSDGELQYEVIAQNAATERRTKIHVSHCVVIKGL